MSNLAIGFIAFSCIFALGTVTASNITQVEHGIYLDSACTQPQPYSVSNSTAGDCVSNFQSFYPSADNTFVYTYTYNYGANCALANITSVTAFAVGVCGVSARSSPSQGFSLYKIFTGAVNPPPPTPFPPTGFTTTTQYINTTDATPDNTCSSARTLVSAYPTPPATSPCHKYPDSGQSAQAFLDATCTTSVVAEYSDLSCTNMIRADTTTVEFKSCSYGYRQVCSGTGVPDTASLFYIGYKQYDNNQCILNSNTRTTESSDGGCFRGSSISCGLVNGTEMLLARQYQNLNCTGSVTDIVYVEAGMCVVDNGRVQNVTAFCTAPSGPGASSSSTAGTASSTGSPPGGSSSTGTNAGDVCRSVSYSSMMLGMIIGFITIKMYN